VGIVCQLQISRVGRVTVTITDLYGGIIMMGFVFIAFIVAAILGVVFEIKLVANLYAPFEEYDVNHSDISIDSVEQLIEKINGVTNTKVSDLKSYSDKIEFNINNKQHTIIVSDGKAYIDYGKIDLGFKPSPEKFFKILKLSKIAIKATEVNLLMDEISGKGLDNSVKQSKKIKSCRKSLLISIAVSIVSILIFALSLASNNNQDAVNNVRTTKCESYTYGDLIDYFIEEPAYALFNSETDCAVLEVTGKTYDDIDIRMQFTGELGLGLNSVGSQKFKLYYFEFDGSSLDVIDVIDTVSEYMG